MSVPRPEYPRPQFEREAWVNLNGQWTYEFDFGKSGRDRNLQDATGFEQEITVPYCPESDLSGVGRKDFIEMMWYHRAIEIPKDWQSKRVYLRFGAVDYECEVFIDGKSIGRHWGGTSSFSFDITDAVSDRHDLVVWVADELRSGVQTGGKQCPEYASRGCHYTRTTGIWQTVWMEAVAPGGLIDVHIVPDLDNGTLSCTPRFNRILRNAVFSVTVSEGGKVVATAESAASDGIRLNVPLTNPKPWSPDDPFLYDITFSVSVDGTVVDSVSSYAGLRKIHAAGNRIYLNNKPFYQRLVLDQGFYHDGIWTAPSDEALKNDIELSMAAGFNGARLHQKVFEERFHYWADKLGYLTWGETSSWGVNYIDPVAARNFLSEWREIVCRDRNHPSIVAWSPFNESVQNAGLPQHKRFHLDAYDLTKQLDPTRPVNDASGYTHYITDIYTVHNYEQDPEKLKWILTPTEDKGVFRNHPETDAPYAGQPYIIDEFGGIKWDPSTQGENVSGDRKKSWGYGVPPMSIEEFYSRLEGQVRNILSLDHIHGFCYTQLTDVEQEQNGVYFYDRTYKFDMAKIKSIFSMKQ